MEICSGIRDMYYIYIIYICMYIYIRSDQLHLDLDQRTRGFDQEAGSLTNSDQ